MRQDEADDLDKELGWAGRPIERSSVKAQPQQRTSGWFEEVKRDPQPATVHPFNYEALKLECDRLKEQLSHANAGFEEYERKFYLTQDRAEAAEARVTEIEGQTGIYFTGNSLADHDAQVRREALEALMPLYQSDDDHAKVVGFERCGCSWCQAIRALIEKER